MLSPRRAALLVLLLVAASAAQAGAYRAPRAADGHPDLGGLWTSTSLTELERPARFKALTVPDAEAAAYEKHRPDEFSTTDIDDVGGRQSEASFWDPGAKLARIGGQARSSWIVEPADGRLPYSKGGLEARGRHVQAVSNTANPESRTPSERCLLAGWAGAGPPMLNSPYANEYQFVQTRDAVAIHMESVHDVRVVRLDGTAHLPASVRPWMGDSIGHWDGETLVVETTNFNPGDAPKMPTTLYVSMDAKVTERFTRISPTQMLYAFAVDDPKTYSQPWRAEMVFEASKGPIYEYACHEGNYGLPGILAGARHEEAVAKAATR